MKHLKPLCIFILTLFFIRDSNAKIIELNHDNFINDIIDFSTNNYDSSSVLTQEVLSQLSSKNELTEFYFTLSHGDLRNKRSIYVCYQYGNILQRLNCKLICVSETGIFIYSKNSLTYIPYKYIKFIQRGISFGKQLSLATVAGAGFGFISGIATGSNGVVFGPFWGAGFAGFFYITIGGPINLISTISDDYRAKIKYSVSNGLEYRKKVLEQDQYYGNQMQIKDYPSISPKTQSKPIVPQDKIDSTLMVQENSRKLDSTKIPDNTVSTTVEIPKSTKDSVIIEPAKSATAQLKVEFPNLNNVKGKLNTQWLYITFNNIDVNEKKLLAKYKNIQGIQMIAENLQNLNTSELQFLAITIVTLNGYNFRNITPFSESQSQYLLYNEPYLAFEIRPDSEIDPSNFQELDLNNIKLIYSILKAKMN